MRVAYCLSGQPRYVEESLPTLRKYVLDENDCDVFIHTWYDPSGGLFTSSQAGQDQRVGSFQPDTLRLLNELNPIAMTYQRPIDFKEFVKDFASHPDARQDQLASMYYSMCSAGHLMISSGRKYDVVVRTRIDMIYQSPFIIPAPEQMEEKTIYAPSKWQECRKDFSCSDCLTFSTYENMLPVFSLFTNFAALNKTLAKEPFAETYYGYNIMQSGCKVISYPIDMEIAQRIKWEQR